MPYTTKREALAHWPKDEIVSSTKVANNTFKYETTDGCTRYRLHHTDIVIVHPDGTMELNTGGWHTVTTKERMNRFLPWGFGVYQRKSVWYLSCRGGSSVLYMDGMTILPDGTVEGAGELSDEAQADATLKLISKFCRSVGKLDILPNPNPGDCMMCQMETQGLAARAADGSMTGRLLNDPSHLRTHLEEGYIHGTLLMNAIIWTGYRADVVHQYGYKFFGKESVLRSLRRYLKFQLGFHA